MSTVRTVVTPGWIAVTGPDVDAVVAAADRHAPALEDAARGGLLALLEALTAHGLSAAPDLVASAPTPTGLRVVVRGAGVAVLPDGTRVGSDGRMPWADLDVHLAEGAEVVLEAPEPQAPRGWRRPARLSRGTDERAEIDQMVTPGTPERAPIYQLVTAGTPELEAAVEPEPKPEGQSERDNIDLLVDLDPAEGPVGQPDTVDAAPDDEAESAAVAAEPEPVAAPQPDLTLPPPDDAVGLPPVARVPAPPPPRGGLIDSVPWRRPGGESPARSAGEAPPAPPAPSPTELLTVIEPDPQPVPDTAAPAPDDVPAAAAAPAGTLEVPGPTQVMPPASEHGTPDVTTHRGALPRSDDDLDRPVVLAVFCPAGHPSPPHAGTCRTCGREIPPQQPFPTPRPSLGVLRISTGGSVPLDRGVLLGRAPRVNEELPANQRPHLLRVGGADRDISRNHAEVVLEGWHVLVRDLGSTNGTTVTLPGQEPVRLRPTEDQGIEPGTVVTLADEVELTYEVQE